MVEEVCKKCGESVSGPVTKSVKAAMERHKKSHKRRKK